MTELNSEYKLNLNDCRKIKDFVGLYIEFREILINISQEESDFEIGGYRFIKADDIDSILEDELDSDPYIIGSLADWLLSNVLNIDIDIVKVAQDTGLYDELGDSVIRQDAVRSLKEKIVTLDGYGSYFARYDRHEHSITGYYCFRIA